MSYANEMPTLVRTDAGLASALRNSVMRLARRLRGQRADNALTLNQLAALATLDRHGSLTLGDLAAHERVQPPSMTRIVSSLEQLGLVARVPHPDDRRQVVISLTEQGAELLAADRRRRDAWLAQQLKTLTPDERDILRKAVPILERLAIA